MSVYFYWPRCPACKDLSFPTRDQTYVPCIGSTALTTEPPGKVHSRIKLYAKACALASLMIKSRAQKAKQPGGGFTQCKLLTFVDQNRSVTSSKASATGTGSEESVVPRGRENSFI